MKVKLNNYYHSNRLSTRFLKHFIDFSQEIYPDKIFTDSALSQFICNLYLKSEKAIPEINIEEADIDINIKHNEKDVLIGFSGGKDGVAVAIKAKQMGLNPILYHLYGINRTYRKEVDNARKLAEYLEMEIIVESIDIKGKQHFPDHPFKNQMIISHMVDYGIGRGITKYSLGNHKCESIQASSLKFSFSDSGEQIDLYNKYIKSKFNEYEGIIFLKNNTEALELLASYDPYLFQLTSSCVFPPFRRPIVRGYVTNKYGSEVLLDNRCGCYCFKCTKEYMVLSELGILPYIKEYYDRCEDWQKTKSPVSYN